MEPSSHYVVRPKINWYNITLVAVASLMVTLTSGILLGYNMKKIYNLDIGILDHKEGKAHYYNLTVDMNSKDPQYVVTNSTDRYQVCILPTLIKPSNN